MNVFEMNTNFTWKKIIRYLIKIFLSLLKYRKMLLLGHTIVSNLD